MKLLCIGLDAADYATIKQEDYFKPLREKSSWGLLKSIHSSDGLPHTGPCFGSIYTGVRPGMHGITTGGWLKEHKTWVDFKTDTVFDSIQKKYSLGLMTMPVTYPAKKVNGWMVSGFPVPDKPEKEFSHNVPKKLLTDFKVDFLNLKKKFTPELAYNVEVKKLELASKLPSVDVMFLGLTILDRAGHFGTEKEFKKSYEYAELLLTTCQEAFKPERIMIFSDHGMDIEFHRHNLDGFWLKYPGSFKDVGKEIIGVRRMIEKVLKLDEQPND